MVGPAPFYAWFNIIAELYSIFSVRYNHIHKDPDTIKLIKVIIKPFKLDEVKDTLSSIGIDGITISFGQQKGHTELYRGAEYVVGLIPKIKLEIAVSDDIASKAILTIQKSAKTGRIGDGKIFVMEQAEAVRIRTGETGNVVI